MELKTYLQEKKEIIEIALEQILSKPEMANPEIHEAMCYSVFAGGKGLGPFSA